MSAHGAKCQCHPVDVARAMVLQRFPPGGCLRCFALNAQHGLDMLQDRTREGLFLQIADAIGEPDEVLLVGEAWDDVYLAIGEILDTALTHTCGGADAH